MSALEGMHSTVTIFNDFVIKWGYESHYVRYCVYEIDSREVESNKLFFSKAGDVNERVEDIANAEIYLEGSTKWDGCTNIGGQSWHLCGRYFLTKHIELLQHLYENAFILMDREEEE